MNGSSLLLAIEAFFAERGIRQVSCDVVGRGRRVPPSCQRALGWNLKSQLEAEVSGTR